MLIYFKKLWLIHFSLLVRIFGLVCVISIIQFRLPMFEELFNMKPNFKCSFINTQNSSKQQTWKKTRERKEQINNNNNEELTFCICILVRIEFHELWPQYSSVFTISVYSTLSIFMHIQNQIQKHCWIFDCNTQRHRDRGVRRARELDTHIHTHIYKHKHRISVSESIAHTHITLLLSFNYWIAFSFILSIFGFVFGLFHFDSFSISNRPISSFLYFILSISSTNCFFSVILLLSFFFRFVVVVIFALLNVMCVFFSVVVVLVIVFNFAYTMYWMCIVRIHCIECFQFNTFNWECSRMRHLNNETSMDWLRRVRKRIYIHTHTHSLKRWHTTFNAKADCIRGILISFIHLFLNECYKCKTCKETATNSD